jgi:uncharacterized damage-inducible protein DinB
MEALKYPIGPYREKEEISTADIALWIDTITQFPVKLGAALQTADEEALNRSYRLGGWSVRQLIHHCADRHMNSYIRFKLALTSSSPSVSPYDENEWALLPDSLTYPIEASLKIIEGVHERWVFLLKSMSNDDFNKTFYHPQHKRAFRLNQTLSLYAWHSEHHLGHVLLGLKQQ